MDWIVYNFPSVIEIANFHDYLFINIDVYVYIVCMYVCSGPASEGNKVSG